mmetsp:Transcript_53381/g.130426  ORF Transcript_53381/g.130426 Transcript_53381/m.130426 type:complete len:209 (-) Transcript_53381:1627-2253(-)
MRVNAARVSMTDGRSKSCTWSRILRSRAARRASLGCTPSLPRAHTICRRPLRVLPSRTATARWHMPVTREVSRYRRSLARLQSTLATLCGVISGASAAVRRNSPLSMCRFGRMSCRAYAHRKLPTPLASSTSGSRATRQHRAATRPPAASPCPPSPILARAHMAADISEPLNDSTTAAPRALRASTRASSSSPPPPMRASATRELLTP